VLPRPYLSCPVSINIDLDQHPNNPFVRFHVSPVSRGIKVRINSLDGIRGVAILSVLLLHHKLFNNGWMGVDLFFVLSGFLITRNLRKDKDINFFWRHFYFKRATRILPPMLLTCLLTVMFVPYTKVLVVLGYIFTLGGIIDLDPHHFIEPLGPLWSLAVEEHFYLVWPFVIRFLDRKQALTLLSVVVTLGPLLRMTFSHPMPTAALSVTYFLTPFRVDEMAFGCLLALLIEDKVAADLLRRYSLLGFSITVSIYLFAWLKLHHIYFYPGGHTKLFDSMGYWLVALASFFLTAHVYLQRDSFVANLMSFGPLAFLGRISYGIYLYHILIRTFIMWYLGITSQKLAFVFDIPLVLILSFLSFKYYEQPIIDWGRRRAAQIGSTSQPLHSAPDIQIQAASAIHQQNCL
jgi:peptidoglycan/LPS O-acetylase OafA/YrhL